VPIFRKQPKQVLSPLTTNDKYSHHETSSCEVTPRILGEIKTLVGVGWAVSLFLCRNDFRNEISLVQKPSVLKMETSLCEKTAF